MNRLGKEIKLSLAVIGCHQQLLSASRSIVQCNSVVRADATFFLHLPHGSFFDDLSCQCHQFSGMASQDLDGETATSHALPVGNKFASACRLRLTADMLAELRLSNLQIPLIWK